jgi:hypothetical protein
MVLIVLLFSLLLNHRLLNLEFKLLDHAILDLILFFQRIDLKLQQFKHLLELIILLRDIFPQRPFLLALTGLIVIIALILFNALTIVRDLVMIIGNGRPDSLHSPLALDLY